MELKEISWVTLALVIFPFIGWLFWYWNDIWYGLKLRMRDGSIKLPPGNMGLPFFGETLRFLWYFKISGRPDDFINSKRERHGDAGIFKTHLFGSPSMITWSPELNKLVLQNHNSFRLEWPAVELVGTTSLVAVHGPNHARLRTYVIRAINQPEALRYIALMVQPRIIAALQSWSDRGRVVAYKEAKKVTFQNIGKFFASMEPGPVLDNLNVLFTGLVKGVRAYPLNFPGFAYHHALQCRRKATDIFKKELEKKRKRNAGGGNKDTNDLMDGLMELKDDEGKQLSEMEILDNIISLLVAGYESTTLAITSALYYLTKFPDVLQKLREENMQLSKKKNGELITSDDIAKLEYTNKVVEESIRMANISSLLFRTVTEDVQYKGYTIPKGWKVIVWARYLHTNPENFDDPMCLNPDRWNEAAKPGTYLVFGGGIRICAGNMLARLQLAVFLHHLATGYKWDLVNPNAKMVYLPHQRPVDGVEINFSKI